MSRPITVFWRARRRIPDALFKLHGEGENRDDVWDKYFAGGEMIEKVYAVMFMPEPKKVKWEV